MNFVETLELGTIIFTAFTIVLVWFTKFNINNFNKEYSLRIYLLLIFSIMSIVTSCYFLIRKFFNILKENFIGDISYLNNYLYLALAIMFLTFFGGYFYIKDLEEGGRLKGFLKVLSIVLLSIFASVSALKSILQIN